jgi:hypothetical protein
VILAPSACVFLGWLQARSAVAKLRRPGVFQSILQRYPFGARLQRLGGAKLVPAAELAMAGALLLPVPQIRLLGCCAMLAFLALASAAIYGRYRRGEQQFACGCSGNLEEQTYVSGMLIGNGLLLLVTAYGLAGYAQTASPADYGIGLALLLAFDLFHTALTEEGRVRSWMGFGSDLT